MYMHNTFILASEFVDTDKVELTFKVNYKDALQLIAFSRGEIQILPDEMKNHKYTTNI